MPAGSNRRDPAWGDLADAGTALWDMGAGALRGMTAATAGLPGDIESLVRRFTMGGETTLPTTEDIKKKLPVVTHDKQRKFSADAGEAAGQNFPQPQLALRAGVGYAKGVWDAAGKISDATPKGQMNMFFGPGAKKADLVALQEAKAMHATGEPPEDIWSKTGWFDHPKDGWKFEVSDHNVFFRGLAEAAAQRPKELAKMSTYDSAIYLKGKMEGEGMSLDQARRAFQQEYGHKPTITEQNFSTNNDMQSLVERGNKSRSEFYAPMESTSGKMMDHRAAYEQMPELENTQFATANLPPEVYGQAYRRTGRVELNRSLMMDTEQARSTGLHEMSHIVQDRSGWQPGTNPNSIFTAKNAGAKKMEQVRAAKETELSSAAETSNLIGTAREVRDLMTHDGMTADQALLELVVGQANHYGVAEHYLPGGRLHKELMRLVEKYDHPTLSNLSKTTWSELKSTQKQLDAIPAPVTSEQAHSIYKRSYGETEARVVQKRRDLTSEERRQPARYPMHDYREESRRGMLTEDEVYDPMKRIMP